MNDQIKLDEKQRLLAQTRGAGKPMLSTLLEYKKTRKSKKVIPFLSILWYN